MSTLKVDTITDEAGTGAPTLSQGLNVNGGTIKLDGAYPIGTNNVALGNDAFGSGNLTGNLNTAVGREASFSNTSGQHNVALGQSANYDTTTGSYNVGVGSQALRNNTTASNNTAVGYQAGYSYTTSGYITAIGYQAGYSSNAGGLTAVGAKVLYNNTGAGNVGVGGEYFTVSNAALFSNTSGASNTAVGVGALTSNTTASNNTAVGYQSLYDNTTGEENVAVGRQALANNTTANNNSALGYQALHFNTTGANNTAVGREALENNTTASYNTALGYQAGYAYNGALGSNTYVGFQAGQNSTGDSNTFVGARVISSGKGCGQDMTTGAKNTILGAYSGNQGGLDIRTSSNNIVLSDGDGNPRVLVGNSGHTILSSHGFSTVVNSGDKHVVSNGTTGNYTCVFENVTTGSPYGIFLQFPNLSPNNTSNTFISAADSSTNRFLVFSNGNVVNTNNSYGAISDVKLKENIVDASSQWDDIKALTVRKYSMKSDNLDAPNMLGVIAQEVESAGMGGLVFESPDKDSDNNDLGTVTKQVNYSILYMKAVKALQEAMDRIETLEADVAALKNP